MQLDEVVPWGRSFSEYCRMFALSEADLGRRVLGCGDGPASFNAEATALGHDVISCDPIYAFSGEEIRQRVEACYGTVVELARQNAHRFVWEEFANADALGRARLAAMERFLGDLEAGGARGRYVATSLPRLPFGDRQFDLCVCSHFLFLYAKQLDLMFHLAAVREMLRVAREVQIFPLLDLEGRASAHVVPVRDALLAGGWDVNVVRVAYEFQRGGDSMLVVKD
jgi:SAM-dependent methyltransferase